jgi:nitrite reductase (NADH) small subunit
MSATGWLEVCAIDDIPVLGSRVVTRAVGANVAVFRTSTNQVFALLDRCPHKGGPLSQGIVFGERVACPLHNWSIELRSGEAVAPDQGCAAHFAVYLADGKVHLDATELRTRLD